MRRINPFVVGHVIGALAVGAIAGLQVPEPGAVLIICGVMVAGAAVSGLVCWRWPGFAAVWWKLWLIGCLANPLLLVGVIASIDDYKCLLGGSTGWGCMFADVGPLAVGLCLPSPLAGLALRWWRSRKAS